MPIFLRILYTPTGTFLAPVRVRFSRTSVVFEEKLKDVFLLRAVAPVRRVLSRIARQWMSQISVCQTTSKPELTSKVAYNPVGKP